MKKIAVLGAAGGLGLAVSAFLKETGKYDVRALVAPWDNERRVGELRKYASETVIGDVSDGDTLRRLLQDVHVVVNCAAVLPGGGDRAKQYEVNVSANERILRLAKELRLLRAVFISTAGVASHHGSVPDDERAPFRVPQNDHVWSKIENEKMLDRVSEEINYPCIILRPVSVYGPHMTFRWREIINYVRSGTMMVFDHPNSRYPLIHEKDLARSVFLAIEMLGDITQNEKFIISSDEPLSLSGIVFSIAKALGVRPPRRVPYAFVLLGSYVLSVVPRFLKPERLTLITPQSVREYRYGHSYNTEKAKQLLGFSASMPFEEAIQEVVRQYV